MKPYTLHVPTDIERQIDRCRASIRASIRQRLQEILDGAAKRLASAKKSPTPKGPPLRFYVYDGYRVSYQVNPVTRSILVLALDAQGG